MTRVAVFIDYQNVYKGARECFGLDRGHDFTRGQIYPRRVGVMLADKGRHGPKGNPSRALKPLWCHWLDEQDYGRVEDRTDYTKPQGDPPSTP